MVQPLRDAGTAAENVSDWAEAGGMPPGWDGEASQAASHAMTRMACDAGAAVAVLNRAATALDTYFDTVETLQERREDLVEERSSLAGRQLALSADGASYPPDEEAGLRQRATDLQIAIDAFGGRTQTWADDLTRAEDTVIATLQGSDTATEARDYAASRAGQVRSLLSELARDGTLPPGAADMTSTQLRSWLIQHPDAAAALLKRRPMFTGGPGSELAALLTAYVTKPGGGGAVDEQRRLDARALFEGLSTEDATLLAMLYPGVVGNLDGVPFENRADANAIAVVDALVKEKGNLDALAGKDARNEHDGDWLGRNNNDLDGSIADARKRVTLYESILGDDRQILYFDPSGDGAIAELHGSISDQTRNLSVLVPGTGADMAGFQGVADRSDSFVDARPGDDLAVISWLGGDMPDSVPKDAPFADYSQSLAPRLANFSHDVRLELDRSAAAGNDPATTYVGHSYGGAAVGLSEASGLDANRVLHVESAGVGHDISSPSDLPASQDDVRRYSMTAPGDPIAATQGQQNLTQGALGPWNRFNMAAEATGLTNPDNIGHGADPDTFGDTVRLDTGNYEDGEIVRGAAAHSGVFTRGSDPWGNMLNVMTGETADTYREPVYRTTYSTYGSTTSQSGWGPGGTVDIP